MHRVRQSSAVVSSHAHSDDNELVSVLSPTLLG